ncbi:MAG: hypothetical protein ACAI44_15865 [Candidatus Sericytochromatia bacterium]
MPVPEGNDPAAPDALLPWVSEPVELRPFAPTLRRARPTHELIRDRLDNGQGPLRNWHLSATTQLAGRPRYKLFVPPLALPSEQKKRLRDFCRQRHILLTEDPPPPEKPAKDETPARKNKRFPLFLIPAGLLLLLAQLFFDTTPVVSSLLPVVLFVGTFLIIASASAMVRFEKREAFEKLHLDSGCWVNQSKLEFSEPEQGLAVEIDLNLSPHRKARLSPVLADHPLILTIRRVQFPDPANAPALYLLIIERPSDAGFRRLVLAFNSEAEAQFMVQILCQAQAERNRAIGPE